MAILLTGFEPFAEYKTNPTQELVQALEKEHQQGQFSLSQELKCLVLPVDYNLSWAQLKAAMDSLQQEGLDLSAVVCTGLAAERRAVSLEAQARNPQGPEVLPCRLPFESLTEALTRQGLPVEISQDAGSYVCNSTIYKLLSDRALAIEGPSKAVPRWAGFIHFPSFASLSFADALRSLKLILEALDRDFR